MASASGELPTAEWVSVFAQAADLGVLQLDLTGGEPLARSDVVTLVAAARRSRLYVNLITSGIGLTPERLGELVDAGLDHLQLSFQDVRAESADTIAGARVHARKIELARKIAAQRLAFTINIVVHRQNLKNLEEMIALAEELGAQRLEIANVQYYGWALENRNWLLPTREQLDHSLAVIEAARERLKSRLRIDFVVPDYYAKFPKACMGGWGRKFLLIDPAGQALPCHAAGVIPGMHFDSVRERPLRWIWEESSVFCKFRGQEWMPEPCRSCDRREIDFGGCRCQALLLAGDASVTDPTCSLAPRHEVVLAAVAAATEFARSSDGPVDAGDRMLGACAASEDEAREIRPGIHVSLSNPDQVVRPAWLYRKNPPMRRDSKGQQEVAEYKFLARRKLKSHG
jgi:pyrroloquinoline quinone biosynthesis protein E